MESMISSVAMEILKWSADATWKSAARKDKILKILETTGLKPEKSLPEFDHVYAYTLLTFGVSKPCSILEFFRHEEIKNAFRESFEKDDPAVLREKAAVFTQCDKIGDALRKENLDPRREFDGFAGLFDEVVKRTRTPAEILWDRTLTDIQQRVKNIESLIAWSARRDSTADHTDGSGLNGNFDKEIASYRRKAESLHAFLPVAGFAQKLKVPIEIEDVYVPLRAMLDLSIFQTPSEDPRGFRGEAVQQGTSSVSFGWSGRGGGSCPEGEGGPLDCGRPGVPSRMPFCRDLPVRGI